MSSRGHIASCRHLVRALLVSASSAPSAAGLLAWASMLWEWWCLDLATLITLRLIQTKNFRVKTEENSELMFEKETNVVLPANDMSMTYQCQCQWHVIDLPPKKLKRICESQKKTAQEAFQKRLHETYCDDQMAVRCKNDHSNGIPYRFLIIIIFFKTNK